MKSAARISELSVGVRILDCDHREMSGTVMEIQADELAGKERSRTHSLLRKLADFALVHFALEEGLMAAAKYPAMALHALKHQRMIEQIQATVARYRRRGFALNGPSLGLLDDWHTGHVQRDDLDFGLWLDEIDCRYTSNESCPEAKSGETGFGSEASS